MATNEGYVYFGLYGDNFEPDDLTELLGIEATSIKRKGERVPGRQPAQSHWKLSTPKIVDECVDVYAMSTSIVSILIPKKELILEAIEQFNVRPKLQAVLWISVDEEQSTPAIGFEVETIKFLGEIGAYVDIDMYRH